MTIDLVPTIRQIPIASLRLDGGTQIRQARSEETIADYAEKMRAGEVFPPVIAYYDGAEYWLADGFQRVMARGLTGASTLNVDVRPGTQRDAILFACGANAEHGAPRTNADKRRAVEVAVQLIIGENTRPRAEEIAAICRVGRDLAFKVLKEFEAAGQSIPSLIVTGSGQVRNAQGKAKSKIEEAVKESANDGITDTALAAKLGVDRSAVTRARKRQATDDPAPEPRKSPIEGLLSTIVAVHAGWEGYAERFSELWPKATDEDRAELIKRLSECRRQASKFIHALEKM